MTDQINLIQIRTDGILLVQGLSLYLDSLEILYILDDSMLCVQDNKTKDKFLIRKVK